MKLEKKVETVLDFFGATHPEYRCNGCKRLEKNYCYACDESINIRRAMIGDVLHWDSTKNWNQDALRRIFPKALSNSQLKRGVLLHRGNVADEIVRLWEKCDQRKSLNSILDPRRFALVGDAENPKKILESNDAQALLEFLFSLIKS